MTKTSPFLVEKDPAVSGHADETSDMKIFALGVVLCLLAAGCTGDPRPMTPGDQVGGGTIGNSFPGSSGAGAKNSSGSPVGTGATGTR